jgi:release factor glutamine methyltransferase
MAELSVAGALAKARATLVAADTPTATLDARLLLQAVLQLDHADIISQPERRLSAAEQTQLEGYVERRLAHEPVSKILGQRDFYGRAFYVTADVLDPRADTETVIELALQAKPSPPPNVLDLGCGSGALICTLLAEWPGAAGVAVDVSAAALAVTQRNAGALGIGGRLQTLQGSWFGPVEGRFDLVVSNPPIFHPAKLPVWSRMCAGMIPIWHSMEVMMVSTAIAPLPMGEPSFGARRCCDRRGRGRSGQCRHDIVCRVWLGFVGAKG